MTTGRAAQWTSRDDACTAAFHAMTAVADRAGMTVDKGELAFLAETAIDAAVAERALIYTDALLVPIGRWHTGSIGPSFLPPGPDCTSCVTAYVVADGIDHAAIALAEAGLLRGDLLRADDSLRATLTVAAAVARTALTGDSNDAEHDALYDLFTTLTVILGIDHDL